MNKVFIGILIGVLSVTGLLVRTTNTKQTTSKTEQVNEKAEAPLEDSLPSEDTVQIKQKSIRRLNLPSSQVIFLTGPIMENAADIVTELKAKENPKKELYILIDSPGGSVLDGAGIISAMEASRSKVNTVCMALCASMAFMIHQYGNKRLAVDRSVLMAHPASGGFQGTVDQIRSRFNMINKYVDKMDGYIANRIGMPFLEFKQKIMPELWLDAEDALEQKYVDELVDINTDAAPVQLGPLFGDRVKTTKEKINLNW